MAESKLAVASMDFAVKILKLCDGIKGHYSIVNQLERSATSIGANLNETTRGYYEKYYNCRHAKGIYKRDQQTFN